MYNIYDNIDTGVVRIRSIPPLISIPFCVVAKGGVTTPPAGTGIDYIFIYRQGRAMGNRCNHPNPVADSTNTRTKKKTESTELEPISNLGKTFKLVFNIMTLHVHTILTDMESTVSMIWPEVHN